MNATIHQACLLLGSNIEPERNIPRAMVLLKEKLTVLQVSSIWESASVDCCYPDYLNMALSILTPLDAQQLKEQVLRPLEVQMGRVRTEDKNASRPIDFDIILFDGFLLDPTLWQHAHQAVPVAEIFPDYASETGESLKDVAMRLAHSTPVQIRKDISISLPSHS
ncbi:MAG: 2-amino-4-hydroxy-6-hydroxymethyldihydropteridine diphosphokinase [Anaerolineales bacterium]|jgi:2-amino-4-hydroxy-6-hydroxymethyldihydropteridine diphosphokinase